MPITCDGGDEHRPETRYRPLRRPRLMVTATHHLVHHRLRLLYYGARNHEKTIRIFLSAALLTLASARVGPVSESARSISRCISSAVRGWPFASLNITFSRIAGSATSSAMTAWPVPSGSHGGCLQLRQLLLAHLRAQSLGAERGLQHAAPPWETADCQRWKSTGITSLLPKPISLW